MSSMKFEIDRFNGRNNFNIWKIQMMALLRREGSIHAIDGKYPTDISAPDKEKIEGDALSAIQLSLAPNVLCEVSTGTEETAKQLWEKLEGLYQDRSVTTRMLLQRRLHTFKMGSGTSLQDHLDAFNKLVMDLQIAGIKREEETLACALLFSLTSGYRDIENSMMYSKELIKLEQVRQALNSSDVRRHIEGDRDDQASGLFVRGRTSQQGKTKLKHRSKSRVNKKNTECWGCGKKGHFERDCPMSKSKEKASASTVEQVRVVSPDKDFFQILSPSLRLLRIAPRGFEMVSFGMEDFAGKYGGLKPSQFVDLISLTGVHGIGDVHAIQLIMKFGTLENLLERVEQVEEERIRKVLLSNAELARLSKDLAILRCDLPSYMVPFAPDDLIFEKPEDGGEKFTSLLTAISAYAEGFSADTIIRRALYLWKKLEKQNTYTVHRKLLYRRLMS
ncbi:retrovirus-related Pol polyprotein from transposon TNT 1-94-like isoform X2 [Nicotiana tabacum]|uniref:Retrovirus-related Pol polyprotein from transposon TNT 1-94-like isoform X2 n=1 Tax=Nicotiana tabacum TaxID=4097 RepID=A0AC58RSY9_TOBAC